MPLTVQIYHELPHTLQEQRGGGKVNRVSMSVIQNSSSHLCTTNVYHALRIIMYRSTDSLY